MSDLRRRAKEIKAQGVAERGNFEPHGLPLKIYQYWASISPNVPARENFCHYWRVVCIWAPLFFLAEKAGDVLTTTKGVVGLVIAYIALMSVLGVGLGAAEFTIIAVGLPWLCVGIIVGALYGLNENNERENGKWIAALRLTMPVSLMTWGAINIVNHWPSKWNRPVGRAIVWTMGAFVVGLVGLLTILFFASEGWAGIFAVIISLAVAGVAIICFAYLADFISGRRAEKREARREAYYDSFDEEGNPPVVVVKEPSKFRKFFSGIGDIIVFVAQIVRVKKWKICPLVTVPEAE